STPARGLQPAPHPAFHRNAALRQPQRQAGGVRDPALPWPHPQGRSHGGASRSHRHHSYPFHDRVDLPATFRGRAERTPPLFVFIPNPERIRAPAESFPRAGKAFRTAGKFSARLESFPLTGKGFRGPENL